MNIADSLRPHYVFCTAGFTPFPDTEIHEYLTYQQKERTQIEKQQSSSWRVDGASFGVTFQVVPLGISHLRPLRIDVVIPDQTAWASETWSLLDARDSAHTSGASVKQLRISNHLCIALEQWASNMPNFKEQYEMLPFGSKIVISNIEAKVEQMQMHFVANDKVWYDMLSYRQLKDIWKDEAVWMPPCVDLDELKLIRHLSDDVAVVELNTSRDTSESLIFKTKTSSAACLYHEIKILLTLPKHPSVAGPPRYLVTLQGEQVGQEARVCGFLMHYFEAGTLYKTLPEMRLNGTLTTAQQYRWATEITTALQQILSVPGHFYPDLRMDNIVVGEQFEAILIDHEQGRNVYNWAPPEIYYLEWIAELGHEDFDWSGAVDEDTRSKYSALLRRYLSARGYESKIQRIPEKYDNPAFGWNFTWLLNTPEEKEASQVYLLGKALYCIFEGLADPSVILGRSTTNEREQVFPEFKRTPERMRDLIKRCTAGARELKHDPMGIVRIEGRVYPRGMTGLHGQKEASVEETKSAIKSFWQEEMKKAEQFILSRERYEKGERVSEVMDKLDYLKRPKLDVVRQALLASLGSYIEIIFRRSDANLLHRRSSTTIMVQMLDFVDHTRK